MKINSPWKRVLSSFESRVRKAGLLAVRSFDLQAARDGLLDPSSCPCPFHGQETCSCQYVVYLIYEGDAQPVSVTIHGHDHSTFIALQDSCEPAQQDLWFALRCHLEELGYQN